MFWKLVKKWWFYRHFNAFPYSYYSVLEHKYMMTGIRKNRSSGFIGKYLKKICRLENVFFYIGQSETRTY
jgi:hypothetical protein